jgi:5-deoxy-D-glucuronate isomerase
MRACVCVPWQYVVLKTLAPAAEQAAMRREHGERITLFKQADVGSFVISAGDTVCASCSREPLVALQRAPASPRCLPRRLGGLSDRVLCRLLCR